MALSGFHIRVKRDKLIVKYPLQYKCSFFFECLMNSTVKAFNFEYILMETFAQFCWYVSEHFPCLRGKTFFLCHRDIHSYSHLCLLCLLMFIPVTFNVIIDVLKFGYCFIILYLSAVFLGLLVAQW